MSLKDDDDDSTAFAKNQSPDIPQEHNEMLSCTALGGPNNEFVNREMVYWDHIDSDLKYISPFKRNNEVQYLTFEPDQGGWNNIRMAMETILVIAHAMGRTLVLPPEDRMYLLGQKLDFHDFFNLDKMSRDHAGIDIISMEEFLTREKGKLLDAETNQPISPPDERVKWDNQKLQPLWGFLKKVGEVRYWDPIKCQVGFPRDASPGGLERLNSMTDEIKAMNPKPEPSDYKGKPIPVDASAMDRLKGSLAGDRYEFCHYDEKMQNAKLVHVPFDRKTSRWLVHFYAFVFFEDWRQDLFYKRFIRDYVRYSDKLICAAARVVQAVRDRARSRDPVKNPNGEFDSFHIRRGDFQYKKTRVDADVIYEISHRDLTEGATVYIATDERDKTFFQPLADHYDVVYLDDYMHLVEGLDKHYFGMIDQLVTFKSRAFVGTWFSSFSGYINRLRGYYINKYKLPGYEDGTMKSWYFAPAEKRDEMQEFWPSRLPFYMREFPPAWRDIDRGLYDQDYEPIQAVG